MSGYKRVNFYELCRLCATNQQKEKTHIFTEEGRKIQLQDKIQSCLSLTVCETDSLPKVVCSKCLRSLEVCYSFRQECVTSESMLSSYYQNFRYTEDFRKSGKVYIKDTTTKQSLDPVTSTTTANNVTTTIVNNTSYVQPTMDGKSQISPSTTNQHMNHIPLYTFQLPTLVTNQSHMDKQLQKQDLNQSKIVQNSINTSQVAYNLNTINLAALKTAVQATPKLAEGMSNVVVNANGEVINIAQLVDFESLINQTQVPKVKNKLMKKSRDMKHDIEDDDNIIKIDLTESDNQSNAYDTGQSQHIKYDKLPHIKSTVPNDKYTYTIKMEEAAKSNVNPTVIFNTMTNYQQTPNSTAASYAPYTGNNIYPSTGINIVTTSGTNSLVTSNICNASPIEPSTVNLNVLNHNIPETTNNHSQQNYARTLQQQQQTIPQNNYTNVISSISSASQNMNNNNANTTNNNNNTNSNNNNMSAPKFRINQNNIPINNVHITATNNVNVNVNSNFTNVKQENSENATAVVINNQKIHVCEICQKHFKRKEHLYQHIKLHTGFRPYSCEHCHKSFMRKEHLLRHMTSHSGQKNYTCNICDKSFSRNDNLLKHKKTHDKQSSYACEVCNKQFVMKHYYMAHKLTHDEEQCKDMCALKA